MIETDKQSSITSKQSSTVVGGWSVAVGRALNALGYDGDRLLKAAGVDLSQKNDIDVRFSSDHTRRLWAIALAETGQENIGLQVASYVCPTTFHALGFSLWASSSLRDALQRMVRFEVLLNDGCRLSLQPAEVRDYDSFTMQIKQAESVALVTPEGVDYFLGAVVKMFREMSGDGFSPVSVSFTRDTPEEPQLWQDYFNCPVSFGSSENCLVLDSNQLDQALHTGNRMLAEQNDKLVEEYLERFQMNDLCSQVRNTLINLMPLGLTTLDDVADELNMVARTLQYQLTLNGTTLQKIRDQIREELARQYLQYSRQTITEIAYSLGFSDPAHLNRAFKRWTGESPTVFRRRFSA
ncbi:AraC family transcriptional regulator [Amphritea balenae]|uniref:AraC family transcriptional regulator n=1 Tax=Amphritea balenae TaxID=452629 RepID=A0A3P1SJB3_9GAMM|nr:AraC family transcriptional regulator [Amphritea balenae]RRC96835.1 AraC family transcriptional regulator [Amphritea balenae]GGK61293.1 AraC family transcriptional regulator [Amphritea balenae]